MVVQYPNYSVQETMGEGGGLAEVQVRRSRGCNSLLEPGYYISIS